MRELSSPEPLFVRMSPVQLFTDKVLRRITRRRLNRLGANRLRAVVADTVPAAR